MINNWEIIEGIFTLGFFLAAFYFIGAAGVREQGKRGVLLFLSAVLIGPAFLFDLVSEVYENESAEILSHGIIIIAGLLFLLSFYLSKKELEREEQVTQ